MREVMWRLHEPTEEHARRWSKAHLTTNTDRTLCGVEIPALAYDKSWDTWIPDAAPRCQRCQRLRLDGFTPTVRQ